MTEYTLQNMHYRKYIIVLYHPVYTYIYIYILQGILRDMCYGIYNMGYILHKVYHGVLITGPTLPRSEIAKYYASDLSWSGQISTRGRGQKLRIWQIKDIRPTKRLESLGAPKIAPDVIDMHNQIPVSEQLNLDACLMPEAKNWTG